MNKVMLPDMYNIFRNDPGKILSDKVTEEIGGTVLGLDASATWSIESEQYFLTMELTTHRSTMEPNMKAIRKIFPRATLLANPCYDGVSSNEYYLVIAVPVTYHWSIVYMIVREVGNNESVLTYLKKLGVKDYDITPALAAFEK